MLKPVEMRKVMIIGPTARLNDTVQELHKLNVLHFTDTGFDSGGIFREGSPMERASDYSYKLLKIRAAKQIIGQRKENGGKRYAEQDIDSGMDSVMTAVEGILDVYKQKESLAERIRQLEEKRAEIEPLAAFPVALENYSGLGSVEAFVGTVKAPVEEEVGRITNRFEMFKSGDGKFVALFADRKYSGEIRSLLSTFDFKEFKVPRLTGRVTERIAELSAQIEELMRQISDLESRLEDISAKNSGLLNAAEEVVSADVSKAEAPLRFSVTEREFVATGWVPAESLDTLTSGISAATSGKVYVTVQEATAVKTAAGGTNEKEEDDSPPVKLRNPSPSRPYELLVRLFSLPSYGEYDPTIVVAITFAIFVGLMINDLGYGILMIILGYIIVLYFRESKDMRQLAYILMTSGTAGAVFGVFVFGLAFGIPITARPLLDPADFHVAEGLILLCITIGLLHMGLGYVFRLSQALGRREYRQAAASVGWLILLTGFVTAIAGIGRGNIPIGSAIWNYLFFWASGPTIAVTSLAVPEYSIVLVAVGLSVLIITEGAFALLESISLLANVISYARLAAIAIAGAALAGAINMMLMPGSFFANPVRYAAVIFTLILAQIFIFIMLTLSASIQALRLNYIEFFIKFFKGGGRAYTPFGMSRKYTTER